jgi:hypothetical protein
MGESRVRRVPKEYEDEVIRMVETIKKKFGIKIPKVKACKIILLKSRSTNYILTEHKLLEILGS